MFMYFSIIPWVTKEFCYNCNTAKGYNDCISPKDPIVFLYIAGNKAQNHLETWSLEVLGTASPLLAQSDRIWKPHIETWPCRFVYKWRAPKKPLPWLCQFSQVRGGESLMFWHFGDGRLMRRNKLITPHESIRSKTKATAQTVHISEDAT